MKKSLLLAALFLSSAAQAETWVCAGLNSENRQLIYKFVRQDGYFAATSSMQDREDLTFNLDLLFEDDSLLIMGEFRSGPNGGVSVRMINKITNEFAEDAARMEKWFESVRLEGSCTKV
jgi:hypothetical protein